MLIYMAVTPDKYELPLVVAGSVSQLSRLTGFTRNSILSSITHDMPGTSRGMKFVRVEVPDEEEE